MPSSKATEGKGKGKGKGKAETAQMITDQHPHQIMDQSAAAGERDAQCWAEAWRCPFPYHFLAQRHS